MMTSFTLKNTYKLKNKHILLIDDVGETGEILEACAHKLLEIPGIKVSVDTIAVS